MNRQQLAGITGWLTVLTVLSVGANRPVMGQYALGDGRGLDRNLQAGSGGVNAVAPQIDFRARNDLITGNVPGLAYFRDDVGYRAPGGFSDRVSGDDLFLFQAMSYPSAVAVSRGETYMGGSYGAAGASATGFKSSNSLYRPFSGVGSGGPGVHSHFDLPTAARTPHPTLGTGVVSGRAEDYAGYRPSHGVSGAGGQLPTDRLGLTRASDGRLLEVTASPLLGVRSVAVPRPGESDAEEDEDGQEQGTEDARLKGQAERPQFENGYTPESQDENPSSTEMRHRPSTPAPLGYELGRVLNARVEAGRVGAETSQLEQYAGTIDQAISSRLDDAGSGTMPEAYREVLNRVSRGEDDERADLDAMRRARGLEIPADEDDGSEGDGADVEKDAGIDSLERLMNRLKYDLPPIRSLTGKAIDVGDNARNQGAKLALEADELLRQGRYFDAEDKYKWALRNDPNQPMARVGLVHAELGAGVLRSAALNLRRLFELHPELIAARYADGLIPSGERLESLWGELDQMNRYSRRAGPALLLAYLGYQSGSPERIRAGLDTAAARSPDDGLVAVLRGVWLDGD